MGVGSAFGAFGVVGGYGIASNNKENRGVRGNTQQESIDLDKTNANVRELYPVAMAFDKWFEDRPYEAQVLLKSDSDELSVELSNVQSESGDTVRKTIDNIAISFGDILKEYDVEAPTLTVIVGTVNAIVPAPALEAYSNGNLEEDALTETIGIL